MASPPPISLFWNTLISFIATSRMDFCTDVTTVCGFQPGSRSTVGRHCKLFAKECAVGCLVRPSPRAHKRFLDTAEEAFLEQGTALGLTGLRGHRDLRGIRANNYNSVTLEGAAKLAKFTSMFASQREK